MSSPNKKPAFVRPNLPQLNTKNKSKHTSPTSASPSKKSVTPSGKSIPPSPYAQVSTPIKKPTNISKTPAPATAFKMEEKSSPAPAPAQPSAPPKNKNSKEVSLTELRNKLQNEWAKKQNCDMKLINEYLEEAKLKMVETKYLEKNGASIPGADLRVSSEILEIGALFSIAKPEPDVEMFLRNVAQLKTFYFDYGKLMHVSPLKFEIVGSYLLYLLSENRIADFHMELELLLHPAEKIQEIESNPFVKRVIEIERSLQDGCYLKIHEEDGPQKNSSLWHYFINKLLDKSRVGLAADIIESSYEKLSVKAAMTFLNFTALEKFQKYAQERGWTINNGNCSFNFQREDISSVIPCYKMLNENLDYVKELENIV